MSNHILNLRAYFAARAPAEIPEWYQPAPTTPQPEVPNFERLELADREQFRALRQGTIKEDNASLPAAGLYREYMRAHADLQDWYDDRIRARYFGWRWFYADQMLANQIVADEAAPQGLA